VDNWGKRKRSDRGIKRKKVEVRFRDQHGGTYLENWGAEVNLWEQKGAPSADRGCHAKHRRGRGEGGGEKAWVGMVYRGGLGAGCCQVSRGLGSQGKTDVHHSVKWVLQSECDMFL